MASYGKFVQNTYWLNAFNVFAICKLLINALGLVKVDIVCWNKNMKGEIFINIRIMYGEYSKKEDYDLFGYTYIPAEPKKETLLHI